MTGGTPGLFPVALRFAWRDLRGGWRGLRIVVACLALGVAAVAMVGELRVSVTAGLATHGREILGGDLEVDSGFRPLPAGLAAWLAERGARLSAVDRMQSLVAAPDGDRQLVELTAVDANWPLEGEASFGPNGPPHALGPDDIAIDPMVAARLGLRANDTVRLGNLTLHPRILQSQPDRATSFSLIGPPALVPRSVLPATGLLAPGAMVSHALRAAWNRPIDIHATETRLRAAFPDAGLHLRDAADASPSLAQFIERLAQFLSLAGLAALLVGGIGAATGIRGWLQARAASFAILRCLGASGALIFIMALAEIAALELVGIALGLLAGAVLPLVILSRFGNALPVPPVLGVAPGPLLLAGALGGLTALASALPPLGRSLRVPGAALFRAFAAETHGRAPAPLLAVQACLIAALAALVILTAASRGLALGFCIAAAATLLLFRLGASLAMRAARLLARAGGAPGFRLGLGNLHRPGNATRLMLVSMGLGLSTLATITMVQGNMTAEIGGQMPRSAPSFFFIDIQPRQTDSFARIVDSVPGTSDLQHLPYIASRVTAVNGVPAERVRASADTEWALHGARGLALTIAATPPADTRLVAGKWWPPAYDGPPLVSFDANLAKGWGVHVGDTLTVDVLGREVPLRIASLRRIDWKSLSMNFAMVGSPGLLSGAPHTELATVRVPEAQQGALLRKVSDALPNVTGIRVADILRTIGQLLGQIGQAVAAGGSLTLAAGGLVLAGAVASGQQRRVREAVILKTLGATRGALRLAYLAEFGALGLIAGLLSVGIGAAASYAIMHFVMHADWTPLPVRLAATVALCVLGMLAFGYLGTETALRARAGPVLRQE